MSADDAPGSGPDQSDERHSDPDAHSTRWWWVEFVFEGIEVIFWAIALVFRLVALAFAAIVSSCS